MSAHTSAPWNVIDKHPQRSCLLIYTDNEREVACLYHAPGDVANKDEQGIWRNDAVRLANARLIAAAPDLLSALQNALNHLNAIAPVMERQGSHGYSHAANLAASAIAKANGSAA